MGYLGQTCSVYQRQCSVNPCQNGGLCSENGIGGYTCYCLAGWSGSTCNVNINYCGSAPCQNSKFFNYLRLRQHSHLT